MTYSLCLRRVFGTSRIVAEPTVARANLLYIALLNMSLGALCALSSVKVENQEHEAASLPAYVEPWTMQRCRDAVLCMGCVVRDARKRVGAAARHQSGSR